MRISISIVTHDRKWPMRRAGHHLHLSASLLLWLVLMSGACDRKADEVVLMNEETSDPTFSQLVQIARVYTEERHQSYDLSHPERITRYPDYWEVTWELPQNPRLRAGMPVIQIDRATLEVIDAKFYR